MAGNKSLESLGSVLENILDGRNWQYRLGINRVFLFWEEVVGEEIAAVAQPESVQGAVLWVIVPDSMWMQQLHLQKVSLLNSLNGRLAKECKGLSGTTKIPVVEDIRFKIGQPQRPQKQHDKVSESGYISIDPQREHNFDILSQSIKDDELRASMKRLWLGQEKRSIDSSKG